MSQSEINLFPIRYNSYNGGLQTCNLMSATQDTYKGMPLKDSQSSRKERELKKAYVYSNGRVDSFGMDTILTHVGEVWDSVLWIWRSFDYFTFLVKVIKGRVTTCQSEGTH